MDIEVKDVKQKIKGSDEPIREDARTLRSLIEAFANHDAKVALVSFTRDASCTVTYKTLLDGVRKMAGGLMTQGIGNGDNIAFFAPNSPAWIISALSVIYCGATVVPIDPQQSDEVLMHIIDESAAGWIFTD